MLCQPWQVRGPSKRSSHVREPDQAPPADPSAPAGEPAESLNRGRPERPHLQGGRRGKR